MMEAGAVALSHSPEKGCWKITISVILCSSALPQPGDGWLRFGMRWLVPLWGLAQPQELRITAAIHLCFHFGQK